MTSNSPMLLFFSNDNNNEINTYKTPRALKTAEIFVIDAA